MAKTERGLGTARARLGAVRARLGAARARLAWGGFAAGKKNCAQKLLTEDPILLA